MLTDKQKKILKSLIENGCPDCDDETCVIYAKGVQYCEGHDVQIHESGEVTIDLGGTGSDWTVDPVLIQCEGCGKIYLDRREEVAKEILGMKI